MKTSSVPVDFKYTPHHWVREHGAQRPTTVAEQRGVDHPNPVVRFNAKVGLRITEGVGTMWAAYVFALIALLSLPFTLHAVSARTFSFFPGWLIHASLYALVGWVSSYFLQLVLLPIIIVGQNIQAKASDRRAEDTYNDAEAVLHESTQIQQHLLAQDQAIGDILDRIDRLVPGGPGPTG